MKRLSQLLAVLLALSLFAAACGSDDDDTADDSDDTEAVDTSDADDGDADDDDAMDDDAMGDHLGDGSLGVVSVEDGAEIQIRSLNAISGDVAQLGVPNQRGIEQAVADYGDIKGFGVTIGTGLDDLCSADGGQAAAQTIVADEQVIGVIGTSCSGAATAAAPLISEAGMVMISPSNTSPALTSDQQGNAGENYNVGYYRTAHNDLFQGAAMAEFVFNELGLSTAAAIHDGDPYTEGLASAFTNSFEELGGTVTGFTAVAKEDTDMVPVLTEIAQGAPEALFFPIFQPAGDFLADQAPGVSGLEDTQLIAADGLLVDGFLALEQSEGMFFSGPDTRFGENFNESTGVTAAEFLATYEENNGEAPSAPFWGHAYDATAMLLDAIDAASFVEDGNLMIDRAGVREYLDNLSGYQGMIGVLSCDDFGDCGSQAVTIIEHLDSDDVDASKANVVYAFTPLGSTTEAEVSSGDDGDGEEAAGDPVKSCLVTDLAGIDDKSFNATAWQGVLDAIDNGDALPEPESFFLESDADADWQPNIDQMIDQDCQHIVTVGFALDAVTQENAPSNPDINWTIVDVDFFDFSVDPPEDVTYDNVRELTYQTDEAAFLAGYIAASVTETGIVGTFGGANFPTVSIFMNGFYWGVQKYNEVKGTDVQVLGWDPDIQDGLFTGDFTDLDRARATAQSLLDEGADVIMPVGGQINLGAGAAMQDIGMGANGDVFGALIGVDTDQFFTAPEYADLWLTSVEKKMAEGVADSIAAHVAGSFEPGNQRGFLSNGGVDISPLHEFESIVSQETLDEVEQLRADIISGSQSVDGS